MEHGYQKGRIESEERAGSSDAVLKWDNLRQDDGFYRVPFYFETDPRELKLCKF